MKSYKIYKEVGKCSSKFRESIISKSRCMDDQLLELVDKVFKIIIINVCKNL